MEMGLESFEEYAERCEQLFRGNEHDSRRGQIYWNTLVVWRPDLARNEQVRELDPFYIDGLLPEFLDLVAKLW